VRQYFAKEKVEAVLEGEDKKKMNGQPSEST
jgi:hypothetical protein